MVPEDLRHFLLFCLVCAVIIGLGALSATKR